MKIEPKRMTAEELKTIGERCERIKYEGKKGAKEYAFLVGLYEADIKNMASHIAFLEKQLGQKEAEPCKVPHEKIRVLYNDTCAKAGMTKCGAIRGSRLAALKRRWKEHPTIEWFEELFRKCADSDFLCGKANNDRSWKAGFDFIIKPSSIDKILEGQYESKKRARVSEQPGGEDYSYD